MMLMIDSILICCLLMMICSLLVVISSLCDSPSRMSISMCTYKCIYLLTYLTTCQNAQPV